MKRYHVIVFEAVDRPAFVPDPGSETPASDALAHITKHYLPPALDVVVDVDDEIRGFDNESETALPPRPREIQYQVRSALEAAANRAFTSPTVGRLLETGEARDLKTGDRRAGPEITVAMMRQAIDVEEGMPFSSPEQQLVAFKRALGL